MEASRAQAKAYLLTPGRFAGATATGTAFVPVFMAKVSVVYVDLPIAGVFCQFGTGFFRSTGRPLARLSLAAHCSIIGVYQQRAEQRMPEHRVLSLLAANASYVRQAEVEEWSVPCVVSVCLASRLVLGPVI